MIEDSSTNVKAAETSVVDGLLLAFWVFSYAVLVRGFLILGRFESKSASLSKIRT